MATKTQSEEMGSMWIMKRVLNDNKKYDSPASILNDEKYGELKKIFKASNNLDSSGNVPFSWIKSYYKQQEEMLNKFSGNSFTEFKYSGKRGSFHDYIKKLYSKFGKGKYETWSPADIWIVNGRTADIKKEINSAVKASIKTKNVNRLNSVLRDLFKKKKVIGISLKKVTGRSARFEEVNIKIPQILELDKLNENYTVKKINFNLKVDNSGQFETKEMSVKLEGSKKYYFQIKSNPPNLKFESSTSGSGGRVGKSPIRKVEQLIKIYSKSVFDNSQKNHPKDVSEFESKKDLYKKQFNQIKNDIDTNLKTENEFVDNLRIGFASDPDTANIKLLTLDFACKYLEIPEKERSNFWVDMIWISEKKGGGFAPHGKLY